jgi:DNA-binding MarR family transcriptional regulator
MKDRRLVYVRITPRGQEMLRKIRKPAAELLQSMFSELSPKQLSTLNTLLFAARRTEKSELPAGE